MAIDQQHRRRIFQNLDRELGKLARHPEAEHVHKFRTYTRRVETFLENLGLQQSGNDKKLSKLLGRLRKKAGKIRGLDVQTATLDNLKISSHHGHKAQLLREMRHERESRQKKLVKSLDREAVAELRKRLRRTAAEAQISLTVEPLAMAKLLLAELDKDRAPLTEKRMHQYRLLGKRVRYLAEFAGKNPEAMQFIKEMKRMQDVIGDWHDWLELTARAENLFGRAHDSSLVAVLQNLTRAKFRQAVRVLSEVRNAVREAPKSAEKSAQPRKAAAPQPVASASAAVA
jgi:CHAD domain-containing protein